MGEPLGAAYFIFLSVGCRKFEKVGNHWLNQSTLMQAYFHVV